MISPWRKYVSHGDPAHVPTLGEEATCVCVRVGGRGTVPFACLSGAGERCRHQLPALHDDANLAPAPVLPLSHSRLILPPSSLFPVLRTPCVPFIYSFCSQGADGQS